MALVIVLEELAEAVAQSAVIAGVIHAGAIAEAAYNIVFMKKIRRTLRSPDPWSRH